MPLLRQDVLTVAENQAFQCNILHQFPGLWLANEDGGELILIDAAAPHAVIRTINIQDYNVTTDGNQDGVALIGDYLYVTDFDGDQYMTDDLIYRIDRVTGTLLAWWFVDGFLNPNPNANINMILGICDDGAGNSIAATGDLVSVRVELTYQPITPIIGSLLGSVSLSGSASMEVN